MTSSDAMGRSMWYDRQGNPISLLRAAELREMGTDENGYGENAYVRVGFDRLPGEVSVSTVWLGLDHNYGWSGRDSRPIIFETMVFGGEHDQWQMRYCTEEEAERGHREVVEDLRIGMAPGWSHGLLEPEDENWPDAWVMKNDG